MVEERQAELTEGRGPGLTATDVVSYAVFVGLLAGFAEAGRAVGASEWSHRAAGEVVAPEVFWMAPAAAVSSFLLLACLVLLLASIPGRSTIRRVAPTLFVGVGVFGFASSLAVGLHPLAIVVLSVGIASLVGRAIGRRPEEWRGISRRMVLFGLVAATAWAFWVPNSRRLAEARALEGLATPAAGAPNILLIVWDTVRALNLSLHGYGRETTPTLDRLAGSAVIFERAIPSAPWTLPSHATLFTGLYEHGHGATRDSPLADSIPTLAAELSSRGYRTGGFAANTYWLGRAFGLDRGFQWYEDSWFEGGGGSSWPIVEGIARSWWISNAVYRRAGGAGRRRERVQDVPASMVNDAFLAWLDRGSDERPFFGFLNLFDAHEPYVAREPTGFLFSSGEPRYWWDYTRPDSISPAELEELRETYDAAIFHLDYQLGQLLDALEERRLLDNTLVIVTADHGETLGEHGPDLIGHSKYVYYDVLNVPLVFYHPGRFAGGTRVSRAVSHVDVPATVLDLVGSPAAGPMFPGVSLVPLLTAGPGETPDLVTSPAFSQATPADWQREFSRWPVSRGPLFSLIDGDAHFIVNAESEEQLYDLSVDPWSRNDRIGEASARGTAAALRREIQRLVGQIPGTARP